MDFFSPKNAPVVAQGSHCFGTIDPHQVSEKNGDVEKIFVAGDIMGLTGNGTEPVVLSEGQHWQIAQFAGEEETQMDMFTGIQTSMVHDQFNQSLSSASAAFEDAKNDQRSTAMNAT